MQTAAVPAIQNPDKHGAMGRQFLSGLFGALLLVGSGWAQTVRPATATEILEVVRESPATVKVVNMWATWCAPCVEEFPAFVRLQQQYDSSQVRVFFVSADFEDELPAVRRFLQSQGVRFSFLKQEADDAFVNAFSPEWTGALPATFLYDAAGNLRGFWEGKTTYDQLVEQVQKLLNR